MREDFPCKCNHLKQEHNIPGTRGKPPCDYHSLVQKNFEMIYTYCNCPGYIADNLKYLESKI